ncbi:MAG: DUF1343 domain-containing protein [Armatimonadota bacterium]|nr:DUF1343 domain-containing protein [Armatimonadota bacterium]MDR7436268.1 DUF1343 domain-containing protein [Armatimonadota bacterium]MDR7471352.1 DUF1343 domain-containing protein [Armatimonadota bacterium]MDR7506436.1 DUF1343 domain-containing protein [Armatimonadota bacterium]MDR7508991.1 DUF1343 domain-containing protein [Armatimonadota bacterium]
MRRVPAVLPAVAWFVAVALGPAPADARGPAVRTGSEGLSSVAGLLAGRRVGLVTHHAAVSSDGRHVAQIVAALPGVRVTALFTPEHGFDGSGTGRLPLPSRAPVFSLFGRRYQPSRAMLSRVDVLVVDLQDVGVRPYTYASTMALVMQAARVSGTPVVVLDRPNPMGGVVVDGPVLEPAFRSFIGLYPIPYVHGMTIGELARLYNGAFGIGADLRVVPLQGWSRRMRWADTGLPWVNPSPGVQSADIPSYYAATGAVDGTNLWNGVGTDDRFRVVLAPWLDGAVLARRLNGLGLPGVRFSPIALPHPRTGRLWSGVQLHVTDQAAFRPLQTTVHVLVEIRRLHGDQLAFRRPRRGQYLFDRVWGTSQVRRDLLRGRSAAEIIARWQPGLARFARLRERALLYPDTPFAEEAATAVTPALPLPAGPPGVPAFGDRGMDE